MPENATGYLFTCKQLGKNENRSAVVEALNLVSESLKLADSAEKKRKHSENVKSHGRSKSIVLFGCWFTLLKTTFFAVVGVGGGGGL